MEATISSDVMTLSDTGLEYRDFVNLANLGHQLDIGTICGIFDMTPPEVSEVYRQAGICRPFIEPKSMEALHCAMLRLFLTGRAQYGLNAFGKIEYLGGAIKKADRAFIDMELFDDISIGNKLKQVLDVPESHGWMTKYIASAMVTASEEDRRSILTDITMNGRHSIIRQDYAPMEKFIDMEAMRHRRRKICYSKLQLYCVWDRIRIEACHIYKGNREDFGLAMRGSDTRAKKIDEISTIPLPDLSKDTKCQKTLLKCLKLGM